MRLHAFLVRPLICTLAFGCLGGCSAVVQIQACNSDDDCGADVNVCWLSVCRAGLCDSEFTDADCNDFKDCTIGDHCEGGRCVGDSICPAGQTCVEDDCQPE
jgi:hypothetical protein